MRCYRARPPLHHARAAVITARAAMISARRPPRLGVARQPLHGARLGDVNSALARRHFVPTSGVDAVDSCAGSAAIRYPLLSGLGVATFVDGATPNLADSSHRDREGHWGEGRHWEGRKGGGLPPGHRPTPIATSAAELLFALRPRLKSSLCSSCEPTERTGELGEGGWGVSYCHLGCSFYSTFVSEDKG